MIAEIHGKISSTASNLSERSEDQLTGNFFGALRYLPFNLGLGAIITNCIYPQELGQLIPTTSAECWNSNIKFWPTYSHVKDKSLARTEPDIVIELEDIVILIELKLYSGLSSDGTDDSEDDVSNTVSSHQLNREARLLMEIGENKKKLLIFWAQESMVHSIYEDTIARNLIPKDVLFGYVTWSSVLEEMQKIGITSYQRIILNDLSDLLIYKGLGQFQSFNTTAKLVSKEKIWKFGTPQLIAFDFLSPYKTIRRVYYEF